MAQCLEPTKYGRCRKCKACKENHSNSWVLRMHLESLLYSKNYVTTATLTYRNEDLPASDEEAKKQFQKFMKRLRRDLGFNVRYFAALEKGTQTFRYHWHVIFFGMPFNHLSREYIKDKWGHGFVRRFEPVRSSGAMAYAAKYALKDKCYLMSRKPALGDGMIDSINKTIDQLSRSEKDKLISNQAPYHFIDKEIFNTETGRTLEDKDRLFTITTLRLNGYYYPLHQYIKSRLHRFK